MDFRDKKTLVLGASLKPQRYSNLAIKSLCQKGYSTIALGLRKGTAHCVEIETEKLSFENVDTVTMYLGEKNQKEYEDYIISLKPNRIIFNPGAENSLFSKKCQDHNIETINACTLVMLNTRQY